MISNASAAAFSPEAITVTDLCKTFQNHQVLKNINLTINEGERLVLCGPSGSGKSTLIRCLNGLEKHDAGQINVFGVPLDEDVRNLARIRQMAGMVFQQFNLFPHMTVLGNCVMPQMMALRLSRPRAEENALEFLERVHLLSHAHKYPGQLSGGQQQRVAIARGLCLRPRIMLFDEPTSALDPEMVNEVLEAMIELAADGMTMICVTHEMNFARNVANRVAFLDGGEIVECCAPDVFFDKPRSPRLVDFLSKIL